MSASLQYSNYAETGAAFAVPYNLMERSDGDVSEYLDACEDNMDLYNSAIEAGLDNDSAGYLMPQGMRNILLISATPYRWKHMIGQRNSLPVHTKMTRGLMYIRLRHGVLSRVKP